MKNNINKEKAVSTVTQVALPALTLGAQLATSMKYPQWGLILALLAQPFWLYSSWKSWKDADQIGIFINTVVFTFITAFGIINYWFL